MEINTYTNPFPGLRSFTADESHLFFGREVQVNNLLRKLRLSKFLAIVGNTGSGKSSLINCGVLPALMDGIQGQVGSEWKVANFTPGNDPIVNMALALASPEVLHTDEQMEPNYPAQVENTLRRSTMGLGEVYRESQIDQNYNLLIFIDQFEELFKYHQQEKKLKSDKNDAETFVNLLLAINNQKDLPIYLILTMRSDFLGDTVEFRGLPEAINEGQYLIPAMKKDEIGKAITGPLLTQGVSSTAKLRSRLLNDVETQTFQLPILQHALMRMFDYWTGEGAKGELDIQHYEAVGTMSTALSKHAEEAYSELQGMDKEDLCEKIFKALTDKSSDGRSVKRSVRLNDLVKLTGASQASIMEILDIFRRKSRSFLTPHEGELITDNTYVSISHESLMRVWERLSGWVDEELQAAEVYLRLAQASELHWQGQAGLWRNPELQLGINWFRQNEPNKIWAERYHKGFDDAIKFLKKSHEHAKAEVTQKEDNRRSELKRAKRFTRVVSIAGAIAILLSIVSIGLYNSARRASVKVANARMEAEENLVMATIAEEDAEGQAKRAEEAAKRALENEKTAIKEATKARLAREAALTEKNRAEANAIRAARNQKEAVKQAKIATQKTEEAKEQAIRAEKEKTRAEEQTKIAKESEDKAVKSQKEANSLKNLSLAQVLALKAKQMDDQLKDVKALVALAAYNVHTSSNGKPHDRHIYEGLYDGLKNIEEEDFNSHKYHTGAVKDIQMATNGNKFYSVSSDGKLLQWDVAAWETLKKPTLSGSSASSFNIGRLALNSIAIGEQYVAVAGKNRYVHFHSLSNGEAVRMPVHGGLEVFNIQALPDNEGFVTTGADKTIRQVNINSRVERVITQTSTLVKAISVSKDGKYLAWGEGGKFYVFDRTSNDLRLIFNTENREITSVSFSNDGMKLAVAFKRNNSNIGGIRLYNRVGNGFQVAPRGRIEQHTARIVDIVFSNDNSKLGTTSLDGTAKVWFLNDLGTDSNYQPLSLEDKRNAWAMSIIFNLNSNQAIVGYRNGEIRFWTLDTDILANRVCDKASYNLNRSDWETYIGEELNFQQLCPGKPERIDEE